MNKKIVFIIIGVALVAEIIWAAVSLIKPNSKVSNKQVATTASQKANSEPYATISLKGPASVSVNQEFRVDIILDSSSKTDGADLIIKYDPKQLVLQPSLVGGKQVAVSTGNLYQDYPVNTYDLASGMVSVSGVASLNKQAPSGTHNFGKVTFKAISSGTSVISLEYTTNATTDSNVIESESGKDILRSVNNLTIKIGT